MANNYCQFSFSVPCTKEQGDKLVDMINNGCPLGSDDKSVEFDSECWCPPAHAKWEPQHVWIDSEEEGDPNVLVEVLQMWTTQAGYDKPIRFTWASTCSRPRIDEFDGGGVLVVPGEAAPFYVWPADLISQHAKAKGLTIVGWGDEEFPPETTPVEAVASNAKRIGTVAVGWSGEKWEQMAVEFDADTPDDQIDRVVCAAALAKIEREDSAAKDDVSFITLLHVQPLEEIEELETA